MSDSESVLDGVRLKDKSGADFMLFKFDWRLMTPDANAKVMFETLWVQFQGQFLFALCAQRHDGSWFVYAPDSIADSVRSNDLSAAQWAKVPVVYRN